MELDEPVQQEAKVVEDRRDDEELAKEDEQAFLNPRYYTVLDSLQQMYRLC